MDLANFDDVSWEREFASQEVTPSPGRRLPTTSSWGDVSGPVLQRRDVEKECHHFRDPTRLGLEAGQFMLNPICL